MDGIPPITVFHRGEPNTGSPGSSSPEASPAGLSVGVSSAGAPLTQSSSVTAQSQSVTVRRRNAWMSEWMKRGINRGLTEGRGHVALPGDVCWVDGDADGCQDLNELPPHGLSFYTPHIGGISQYLPTTTEMNSLRQSSGCSSPSILAPRRPIYSNVTAFVIVSSIKCYNVTLF